MKKFPWKHWDWLEVSLPFLLFFSIKTFLVTRSVHESSSFVKLPNINLMIWTSQTQLNRQKERQKSSERIQNYWLSRWKLKWKDSTYETTRLDWILMRFPPVSALRSDNKRLFAKKLICNWDLRDEDKGCSDTMIWK